MTIRVLDDGGGVGVPDVKLRVIVEELVCSKATTPEDMKINTANIKINI